MSFGRLNPHLTELRRRFSMASPRSRYPAYPGSWTGPFIKLHLYLPSGEFVCEQIVYVGMAVDEFTQHLEEWLNKPELDLDENGDDSSRNYTYILVWNGIVLEDGRRFADIVRDHGMSETEPNDITVVKHACGSW